MLKYQLKKGVTIDPGMAFKYNSIEELKALLYALGIVDTLARQTEMSKTSLKESGLLIYSERPSLSGFKEDNIIRQYITRKYLVGSDERIMKKKDFFDKTEYDNVPKNNKGSVGQYDNASNLREQTDINNNGGPVKAEISVHDCGFRTSTSQTCSTTAETNKPFVAYAITDGCGFRVPLETCKEGILTNTVRQKGIFMGTPAEQQPFSDMMYIVGMETDRIKKLVASKFPLFIRTGIHNVASETPSVYFRIPGTFFNFKITLKGEKVIDIEFYFGYTNVNNIYDNALKELIAHYFNLEKQKPKEGTKFEAVTDKNGDTRILMTDSLGNKSTLI